MPGPGRALRARPAGRPSRQLAARHRNPELPLPCRTGPTRPTQPGPPSFRPRASAARQQVRVTTSPGPGSAIPRPATGPARNTRGYRRDRRPDAGDRDRHGRIPAWPLPATPYPALVTTVRSRPAPAAGPRPAGRPAALADVRPRRGGRFRARHGHGDRDRGDRRQAAGDRGLAQEGLGNDRRRPGGRPGRPTRGTASRPDHLAQPRLPARAARRPPLPRPPPRRPRPAAARPAPSPTPSGSAPASPAPTGSGAAG